MAEKKQKEIKQTAYKGTSEKLYDAINNCADVQKEQGFVKGFTHNAICKAVKDACLQENLIPQMELHYEKDDLGVGCHATFIVENPELQKNADGNLFNERKFVGKGYAYLKWNPKINDAMLCGQVSSYASKYAQQKGFFIGVEDDQDIDKGKTFAGGASNNPVDLTNVLKKN
tara:strand:- start:2420 stop:2935 length:516 start_codon:yes stop_codon:yes gene_type:complete